MSMVGGLDVHRKQITFDYVDTVTGDVSCGQIAPADRPAGWLVQRGLAGREGGGFAVEGCTGWRYAAEELARAGVGPGVNTFNLGVALEGDG